MDAVFNCHVGATGTHRTVAEDRERAKARINCRIFICAFRFRFPASAYCAPMNDRIEDRSCDKTYPAVSEHMCSIR